MLRDLDWYALHQYSGFCAKAFIQIPPGDRGYLTLWKRDDERTYRFKHRYGNRTTFDREVDALEAQALLNAYLGGNDEAV
jgi:hypothetical protein